MGDPKMLTPDEVLRILGKNDSQCPQCGIASPGGYTCPACAREWEHQSEGRFR